MEHKTGKKVCWPNITRASKLNANDNNDHDDNEDDNDGYNDDAIAVMLICGESPLPWPELVCIVVVLCTRVLICFQLLVIPIVTIVVVAVVVVLVVTILVIVVQKMRRAVICISHHVDMLLSFFPTKMTAEDIKESVTMLTHHLFNSFQSDQRRNLYGWSTINVSQKKGKKQHKILDAQLQCYFTTVVESRSNRATYYVPLILIFHSNDRRAYGYGEPRE
uniref:Uncharacterized protein n=1 Tax=Glossina brevipalpis TaxID=37001 RepID=A0A1A9WZR5_9MUSC